MSSKRGRSWTPAPPVPRMEEAAAEAATVKIREAAKTVKRGAVEILWIVSGQSTFSTDVEILCESSGSSGRYSISDGPTDCRL